MKVELFAHTQLSHKKWCEVFEQFQREGWKATDGQLVAFTAIRTCYSHLKPSEIIKQEGKKYFGAKAKDGGTGTDADRLIRHIRNSKHTSTLEHVTFNFTIEVVSRSLLAQLTRHRVGFSFSVQSQRYVKFSSDSRSEGFDYVKPEQLNYENPAFKNYDEAKKVKEHNRLVEANALFDDHMEAVQSIYDSLIALGIPQEDARAVLPNAASVDLFMSANITSLLHFYSKRREGSGAQHEITQFAEALRKEVVEVEPWLDEFFELAK